MIIQKMLGNGIRIVMEKIPAVQSVSMGIWVKAGSTDENENNAGISHLIEHMLFKGTEKRSAKKIAEDVDRIGGHINAFTGKELTCYYIKTLDTNVEQACEILIDMFMGSTFNPEELVKEKDVILEEIKMIEDSPEDDAHDLVSEIVFKGTPLESSIIGTPNSLKAITRKMIMEYIGKEYTTDSIVISVAGNFDTDNIFAIFNGKLTGLNSSKDKKKKPIPIYTPDYKVKVKDVEQSHLCLGVKGVMQEDDSYFPMVILNNITGGSMSSRLFQNIREEKGLAYSVYSVSQSYVADGIFSIYAGIGHNKIDKTLVAIANELKLLAKEGITREELQTAKEQLKSGYVFSQENVNSRMFSIGKNTLLLSRVLTPKEIIEKIDNVTMEDLYQITQRITDIKQYSGVLITNQEYNLHNSIKRFI
ncbi:MAG: pitrilysin family protein [Eubacteriales bacterium]|nr:pitrilysin family protein [Eubacteriales bacterium]MDD4582692.1 pitrilysin family protein [Eubacteriales bacterium]